MNRISETCIVGKNVKMGSDVYVGHNSIIEDNVNIGSNVYIDSNTIIRNGTILKDDCFIGANCIIGEYGMDFCLTRDVNKDSLLIGKNALIRSGSIIYTGSNIGNNFQTGHRVTIRENSLIGNNVSIGTLSDIQGNCRIGDYVRMHSNVHIGQLSIIDSFVWIFPYVVLTNDPTPPSENFVGVHISAFAIIATGAIIMPGIEIGQDSLVAAGAIITKNVNPFEVVAGNPGKVISNVKNIKNKITGESVYPWRYYFKKYMSWEESDFNSWYSTLDINKRKELNIENILE